MIRRFSLGPWGIAAIISITLFVAIAVVALQPGGRILDLTVNFATQAPTSLVASHAACFVRNELGWKRSRHIRRHSTYLSGDRRAGDRASCTDCCGRDSDRDGLADFLGNIASGNRAGLLLVAWCIAAPKRFILFDSGSGVHCGYRAAVVQ